MPSKSKEVHRTYQQKYYQKNHKYYKARRAARVAKGVEWLWNFKTTLSCALCTENDPIALDYHHYDPSKKESLISGMVRNGRALKHIKEEISKCVCLCANCHRKIHKYPEWAAKVVPSMLIKI